MTIVMLDYMCAQGFMIPHHFRLFLIVYKLVNVICRCAGMTHGIYLWNPTCVQSHICTIYGFRDVKQLNKKKKIGKMTFLL